MHLIQDENGNYVHHGHEHTHADGTVHSHYHSHEDGKNHDHAHEICGLGSFDKNKTLLLMKYMLEHNIHHAEELAQMAEAIRNDKQAYETVMNAVEDFKKGNKKLKDAVELMQAEIKDQT